METMTFTIFCVPRNQAMTSPGSHNVFNILNRIETQKLLVTKANHELFFKMPFQKSAFVANKIVARQYIHKQKNIPHKQYLWATQRLHTLTEKSDYSTHTSIVKIEITNQIREPENHFS